MTQPNGIDRHILADGFHALADLIGSGAKVRTTGGAIYVEGRDQQFTCERIAEAMRIDVTGTAPDGEGRTVRWWIGTLLDIPVRVLTTVDAPELLMAGEPS